jgi:hypothetical protein
MTGFARPGLAGLNAAETEALFADLADYEVACDGANHGTGHPWHDDGPGRHYFQSMHTCTTKARGDVYVRCQRRTEKLWVTLGRPGLVFCGDCRQTMVPGEWARYLGPVGGGR